MSWFGLDFHSNAINFPKKTTSLEQSRIFALTLFYEGQCWRQDITKLWSVSDSKLWCSFSDVKSGVTKDWSKMWFLHGHGSKYFIDCTKACVYVQSHHIANHQRTLYLFSFLLFSSHVAARDLCLTDLKAAQGPPTDIKFWLRALTAGYSCKVAKNL